MYYNNVLYDELPTEWNGYELNTGFQIGIQVYLLYEDKTMSSYEKNVNLAWLLFGYEDENGEEAYREIPLATEFEECLEWFLNGWYLDNPLEQKKKSKYMDYYIDQWRIYADFRQIYGINLNESDMHWWEFNGLLWNMPAEQSSFHKAVNERLIDITTDMSPQAKEYYKGRKKVLALDQPPVEHTEKEKQSIDDFDKFMNRAKQ